MVSYCFGLYKNEIISKLYVLQCISMVIDYGCTYENLLLDLNKYIPKLLAISSDEHEFSVQKEMLNVIYLFVKHVSFIYFYN